MSHLNTDIRTRAEELVALYPEPRSALIPLCHLAQEQDGWLRPEAVSEIADLCGVTAAEVQGTATFYDMLHVEPVGTYAVAVCTNIACMLGGALELLEHAEATLGVRAGGTTPDGVFTLHEAECLADCDKTPCVQVNHRYVGAQTPESFDALVDDLRAGRLAETRAHARHARAGAPHRRPAGRSQCHQDRTGHGRAGTGRPRRRRGVGRGEGLMALTDAPKIITARLGYDDSFTLERYLATGGYTGLRKALTMTPEAVAAEVDAASLLGRGGAGFPAGRKWSMLRKNPLTYLVINGDESEPATFKDHMLIEGDPHQILEGVLISAYALQVTQAFIYLRGEFALGLERLQAALNEAYAHGAVGSNIFDSGFSLDIVVHPGAGAYICGEETALLESLEGKRGFPRIKPPFFPAAIGLYGEPTVVNNVETMANIPWIVNNGGAAFAALGRRPLHRDAAVRAGRPRAQPGQLRARDGQDHVPRPDLRTRARRRHPRLQHAQGVHPRRRVGPVVRPGPGGPPARPGRGGQRRLHARLGLGRRHGLGHLHGARRLAHHQVLLPRVVRAVHAVPRGVGLAGAHHVPN